MLFGSGEQAEEEEEEEEAEEGNWLFRFRRLGIGVVWYLKKQS